MKNIALITVLLATLTLTNCNVTRSTNMRPTNTAIPTGETMLPLSESATQTHMGVVVIQGIFDPKGENLLELKPVHRYTYSSPPIPSQPTGRFLVKVFFTNEEVTTVSFDALVADDTGRTQHGFFEVTVPLRGEIDHILITDATGTKIFARIEASEITP